MAIEEEGHPLKEKERIEMMERVLEAMKRMVLIGVAVALVTAAMMLVMAVAGAAPVAFAQGEEIAVTGVIKDAPDKADGTPAYGITDESTVSGTAPPVGYILEGDYSAYVGQWVTVYGTPGLWGEHRVLDVTRIV